MDTLDRKLDLFAYLDYRRFLREWFEREKQGGGMSLRRFSARAGFSSPNYFKLIVDGDRNLSEDGIAKFAVALGFNKQQTKFFCHLVHFNQATTHKQKNQFYLELLRCRKSGAISMVKKQQYRFYSKWYHPVVRELIVLPEYAGDLQKLAKRVYPALSVMEVQKSVRLLEQLGFIEKDQNQNTWRQTTPVMATADESDETILLNYHHSILDVAKRVLDEVPQEKRDISAMTLGIARDKLAEIKNRIQEFRRDILSLVASDTRPEQVVLLSMQLMPLTVDESGVSA